MATRSTTASTPAVLSAAEQLAAYRAQARALRGTPTARAANTPFAVTAGKTLAASRNFFTIVSDVYAVERAPFLD